MKTSPILPNGLVQTIPNSSLLIAETISFCSIEPATAASPFLQPSDGIFEGLLALENLGSSCSSENQVLEMLVWAKRCKNHCRNPGIIIENPKFLDDVGNKDGNGRMATWTIAHRASLDSVVVALEEPPPLHHTFHPERFLPVNILFATACG